MRIRQVEIVPAEGAADRVRLQADVAFEDGLEPHALWLEVPEAYGQWLTTRVDPWIVALAPRALSLGEPIETDLPVDPVLWDHLMEFAEVWTCWWGGEGLEIRAPLAKAVDEPDDGVLGFFSGGVDSFCTVLRRSEPGRSDAYPPIDSLVFVGGFDIPLRLPDEIAQAEASLAAAAGELGKRFIPVRSNLRITPAECCPWGLQFHGCAVASVGLALTGRSSTAYIAGTGDVRALIPWGSTVMTDPLLSPSYLRIIHDAVGLTRIRKTGLIAESDIALRHLRVCYKRAQAGNCSRCVKCYRTMATLDVLGFRGQAPCFDWSQYDLGRIEGMTLLNADWRYFDDIARFAEQRGRHDVARAIRAGLRRTPGRVRRARWARALSNPLGRLPGLWRLGARLRRFAASRGQ